ncbi:MAG: caspase domain-containing protein [Saprospiraceae bacterium]
MRISAVDFGNLTKAILVGVDTFSGGKFHPLASPQKDTLNIRDALTDPSGCNISTENISVFLGKNASKEAILDKVQSLVYDLESEESLLLYFASHGVIHDNEFYICLASSTPDNLRSSAIASTDIDSVLAEFRGRGVLLIIDCCQSAGFAEYAPRFFRRAGSSEYKILLSSAHTDASSWELAGGEGTLFTNNLIRIIQGKDQIGRMPGFIYFSELFEYLEFKIAEDLRVKYQFLSHQHPIYSGVFSKDPLIFLHRNLTLQQVRVKTAKYSSEYVWRMVRRVVLTLIILILLALGIVYTISEKTEFAIVENNKVNVYQGYPGWHLFGFPLKRWTYAIEPSYLADSSPMSAGKPLVSRPGHSVSNALFQNLKSEYQAMFLLWNGQDSLARSLLKTIIADTSKSVEALLVPQILFSCVASIKDEKTLMHWLASSPMKEVRENALKGLVRIDPGIAIRTVAGDVGLNTKNNHQIILINLPDNYSSDTLKVYFNWLLGQDALASSHPSIVPKIIGAALRTGTPLEVESLKLALLHTANYSDIRDIVQYVMINGDRELKRWLMQKLKSVDPSQLRENDERYLLIGHLFYALNEFSDVEWDKHLTDFIDIRYKVFLNYIVQANLKHGKKFQTQIEGKLTSLAHQAGNNLKFELIRPFLQAHILQETDVINLLKQSDINTDDYWLSFLFDAIKEDRIMAALPAVRPFLKSTVDNNRQRAIETLAVLADNITLDTAWLADNFSGVRQAAFRWWFDKNFEAAFQAMLSRLNEESFKDFLPGLFVRYSLSDQWLAALRNRLTKSNAEQSNAALILALTGEFKDLALLIHYPDIAVREKATDFLAYSPLLEDLVALSATGEFEDNARLKLVEQLVLKRRFNQQIMHIPADNRSWYKDLLYRTRPENATPGLLFNPVKLSRTKPQ